MPSTASNRLKPSKTGELISPEPSLFGSNYRPALVLLFILALFLCLQALLPLSTALKIGGDEGFELSKALLHLKGYKFYTDFWDDQPPLEPWLIAATLKCLSPSVLWPRLMTVGFAALLLSSFYLVVLRINTLLAAGLAIGLLAVSPGFLELSCSCMQEIPALGPVVASLALLLHGGNKKTLLVSAIAGAIFAVGLQVKTVAALYLPLVGLLFWLTNGFNRRLITSGLAFVAGLGVAFVLIQIVTGSSFLAQWQQARAAHFSVAQSFEHGSPADHAFEWGVLLKHWDTMVPALVGLGFLLSRARQTRVYWFPLGWLLLIFLVVPAHTPWWSYYYVHLAIPLAWGAGVSIAWLCQRARTAKVRTLAFGLVMYAACALPWVAGRLYLQVQAIRQSPPIYTALVLKEIEQAKPFTKFLFTDQPIYSFYSGIPLPPRLANLSLKRYWSGDMSDAKLRAELESVKPGLILLNNHPGELPFQELLNSEYKLVYQDETSRLYVHTSIYRLAGF